MISCVFYSLSRGAVTVASIMLIALFPQMGGAVTTPLQLPQSVLLIHQKRHREKKYISIWKLISSNGKEYAIVWAARPVGESTARLSHAIYSTPNFISLYLVR